jgi:hypothetical protein
VVWFGVRRWHSWRSVVLSREEFRFGEAVWAVQGRLLKVDVLAVTSAVTPGLCGVVGLRRHRPEGRDGAAMASVAPAGALMLSESTARLVEHIVMLAVPIIKAVEYVEADSFTPDDSIEAFEPRIATTRPSPRGLCRGSTQLYAWQHAETHRVRPPMPRRHRCALR